MILFKTLEFSDKKKQIAYGRFVHLINENSLGGGNIPLLMQLETTMRKLKKMYPKQDFTGINLITVKLEEILTNNS